jgi:hypothetical protein
MIPAFQATTGFYEETLIRRGARGPEKVNVLRTFGQFLGVLGVPPAEGRPFTTAEEMQGAPVAVLSHRFWSTRLNADPAILGKTLALNSATLTVIGVLPPSVQYPEELEVITPATPEMQQTHRRAGFLAGLSRLKPGVTLAEAQGQVDTVAAALATQYPDTDKNRSARLVPFIEDQVEDARPALLLLLATVVSILLIACVNVSGLLLARGAERSRESSIRVSLGAGRGSLIAPTGGKPDAGPDGWNPRNHVGLGGGGCPKSSASGGHATPLGNCRRGCPGIGLHGRHGGVVGPGGRVGTGPQALSRPTLGRPRHQDSQQPPFANGFGGGAGDVVHRAGGRLSVAGSQPV